MNKITVKSKAKVNFTLDICGVENGFHNISSIVCSISVFDRVIVKKRKDNKITLKCRGLEIGCDYLDNNAYKTAKLLQEKFNTSGVDIFIDKKIPVGGGLGGSSADICAILIAMKKLFSLDVDLVEIANSLGSDTGYMLNGGWAVISGRGDVVEKLDCPCEFYLLLIKDQKSVLAKDCYKLYDKLNQLSSSSTQKAKQYLLSGDKVNFLSCMGNDLYAPAKQLNPQIEINFNHLKQIAPCVMTGSGSTVVGVFLSKKALNQVYKKLKPIYQENLIKTKTMN